jgi:hypothetical protein
MDFDILAILNYGRWWGRFRRFQQIFELERPCGKCLGKGFRVQAGADIRVRPSRKLQKVPGNRDENWHEFFSVILVPNPLLNVNQQKIVAQDYCMDDGKIAISIRRSFLYYFRKRLRLDVAQVLDEVRETPVVVENQEEFEAALIEADR